MTARRFILQNDFLYKLFYSNFMKNMIWKAGKSQGVGDYHLEVERAFRSCDLYPPTLTDN